ncbi:MAG: methyltransferase domain-containing protein [bacterium]|nr:methyltransferase domain-containing protein [bacterium]
MMQRAERFMRSAVEAHVTPGARVLDIGAGLRLDGSKGNVVTNQYAWMKPWIEQVHYEVLDVVATYHPDIVGDIMAMPVADQAYDVIFCMAILEHVQKPWLAFSELYRVLKPGGALIGFVPFLAPYHAMPGYYGDYYRFTDDGIRFLAADFSRVDLCPTRGPVESLFHLLPGSLSRLERVGRFVDRWRSNSGKQVAGYVFLAIK